MIVPPRWAALGILALISFGTLPDAWAGDELAIERALAYLGREVPAWSRANKCFSCHNNGDAARALYEAKRLGRTVPPAALSDTTTWLTHPDRWDHNGGDGPFSDKVLARAAFTSGLAAARAAGLAVGENGSLVEAGRRLIRDQAEDGAWRVDSADPIGSPATYGRPLATWLALEALRQADPVEFAPAITRAERWLHRAEPNNAPSAAVVLLAGRDPDRVAAALGWFTKNQAGDGGWGPFGNSPPEIFDTALGVLALTPHLDRPGVADQVRRGRAYLVANQNPDGGWFETTRPSGGESYAQRISTTGWATLALLTPAPVQAAQNLQNSSTEGTSTFAATPLVPQVENEITMADPRNIAHDKKVQDEKKHHHEPIAPENAAVAPQPGKKTPTVKETPHEEPVSTHATSQHHKDKTTGHVEEPAEVKAEADAAILAEDK